MNWPERLRPDGIREMDYDEVVYRHHLYVQWQMAEQLAHVSRQADGAGLIWYVDLPLGVSGAGYDTWLERDAFALRANGGAPPDAFFSRGQNWCFPPLHPEGLRRQRYRYLIKVLREQLRYAKLLRIDHAACLHRLFWIPEGMEATEGTYVRYPAEEMYAILVIESHRAGAGLVGEDLGTVPEYITRSLRRRGIQSTYILPFEVEPERSPAVRPPRHLTLAGLNTHDMPPFAASWKALDIDRRIGLGLFDPAKKRRAEADRAELRAAILDSFQKQGLLDADDPDVEQVLEACLGFLARSRAELVIINLEDLWLETTAQNMPGTFKEHPNWCHRAALSLEELREDRRVLRLLQQVGLTRKAARSGRD
jgi:4-alpha-glucanotransferase